MENKEKYTFEISLSILDHLGRNLYRNFVTILGEAISNSWDADAKNVRIYINENNFLIIDDGIGMDSNDFQKKFLKVGHSKRKIGESEVNVSPEGRPYIGRKGIGKLALLSCAQKITVASKKLGEEYVGGSIDNETLDDAIDEDLIPKQYPLEPLNLDIIHEYIDSHEKGTIIHFENINEGINNSLEFLRKITALYFRFSLIDNNFNIYINDEKITLSDIKDLSNNTEYLWKINDPIDPFITENLNHITESRSNSLLMREGITGFIASVKKPRDLTILGTGERASIDLFVNGRLREKDILKNSPTARIAESYLYGQIHFNDLDNGKDRFTSSREGVIANDPLYKLFLESLKEKVQFIVNDWDRLRIEDRKDGNSESDRIPQIERKSKALVNVVSEEFIPPEVDSSSGGSGGGNIKKWIKSFYDDAQFNVASYTLCFMSENLLRKYIEEKTLVPDKCTNIDPSGNDCKIRNPGSHLNWCQHCKANNGIETLAQQKVTAGTSIKIRTDEDNILMYMDYDDMARIIGNKILKDEDKPYRPLRNSVMHTSLLTQEAKIKLRSVFDNIASTIKSL